MKFQMQRHVKLQFELLLTAAFLMIKGRTRWRTCEPSLQHERGKAKEDLRKSISRGDAPVQDRRTKYDVHRASQIKIGWTEDQVNQMQKPQLWKTHTYQAAKEEQERYNHMRTQKRKTDGFTHDGKNAHHSDFRAAVREIHSVTAADPSALPRMPNSKQQPQQQRTWQLWWCDNRWRDWSSLSQVQWRDSCSLCDFS